jgi:16S rRNA (adenine1518-N6/adenine1519-N6)-dimethyltransferase
MPSINKLPSTRQLIKQYAVKPNRRLGQNFLLDEDIPEKILNVCGNLAGQNVLEIGPGVGSLTRELIASQAAQVIVVEFDNSFAPILQQIKEFSSNNLEVIVGDALKLKLSSFGVSPIRIIANLPYNIGTQLILNWLSELSLISKITVMLQSEVAKRLAAAPGSKNYGSLSVLVQWLCEIEENFDVPPEYFMPPPKVTSTVVTITPRPQPLFDCTRENLEKVLRHAFNQRRKMLKSSLKLLSPDIQSLLEQLNIDPSLRPEQLSIEQFCQIGRMVVE